GFQRAVSHPHRTLDTQNARSALQLQSGDVRHPVGERSVAGGVHLVIPRRYAAWPRCWAQSSMMLTNLTLAVTGGSQCRSTMRAKSSAVTLATYSRVSLCTAW